MPPVSDSDRSPLCQSRGEELANAITHGLGAIGSVVALVFMLVLAEGPREVVSAAIFGTSLIVLYLSSTLYHSFSGPRLKNLFQILDHAAIYLLIAGSYTPFMLVTLGGPLGWSFFGIIWGLALAGIIVKACMTNNREHWLSTALYVFMGWLVLGALAPLVKALPTPGFWLFASGGLSYTLGVIFFALESRLRFAHAIWHLFVLGGSTCHVLAVALSVLGN